MIRRTKTKKTIIRKTNPVGFKLSRKEMRFSVSLVILMGMLIFSLLLLLLSLNKSVARSVEKKVNKVLPTFSNPWPKNKENRTISDASFDFKLTVPAELGAWLYKTGEVKSLTDDSLSNQYCRIFVPLAAAKSNNFDQQNKDILTIRKFSKDEWADITKSCQNEKKDICDAAGELITKASDSKGDDWIYAFTKPADCPKNIEAKCNLADKIIESFNLK
ncbi:MAG: hypothetical protein V1814_02160 [Candidatus Moraniibacteriota bacterium]